MSEAACDSREGLVCAAQRLPVAALSKVDRLASWAAQAASLLDSVGFVSGFGYRDRTAVPKLEPCPIPPRAPTAVASPACSTALSACRSLAALTLALVGMNGCASKRTVQEVAQIYAYDDQRTVTRHDPIVVVPGFLGSYLEHPETGEIAWGRFFGKGHRPSDPHYAELLGLKIGDAPLHTLRDALQPTRVMRVAELELGRRTVQVNAYPGVLTGILLGPEHGTRLTERPLTRSAKKAADGDIPLLDGVAYDWRRDIAESAMLLDEHLDHCLAVAHAHRRAVGLPLDDLRLDVVGHSTGSLVLRYYLRYGASPLPEDGSVPPPTWAGTEKIRRAVFVGPPNFGTLSAFRSAAYGGKPDAILPYFAAPILASFVALYELMPPPSRRAVVYPDGTPVDLYDPKVWEQHRWGLFSEEHADTLAALMPDIDDPERRLVIARRYQARVLARAKQFHRAVGSAVSPPPHTTFHLFASDSEPTPRTLVISRETGKPIEVRMASGDGTVPRSSALADLDPFDSELALLRGSVEWTSVHWVDGEHLGMIGGPDLVDNMLFLLFEHPVRARPPAHADPSDPTVAPRDVPADANPP